MTYRDEADGLLTCAKTFHVRVFLSLCLYTAGRGGAIRELTWDRVDFDGGLIDLGHASGGQSQEPWYKWQTNSRGGPHGSATGCHISLRCRVCRPAGRQPEDGHEGVAAKRAGLPWSSHLMCCRHTAATWMAMAKVPMDQISGPLGHRDVRTTWRIYAKYAPDYLRGAIEALSG